MNDIRYAARTLRRAPGFALAAVATLALGIGATTSIFSLANAMLLRPYPFADEKTLVSVVEDGTVRGERDLTSSYPTFLDWRAQSTQLESLAAYEEPTLTVRTGETVERIEGSALTASAFPLIGATPLAGRLFNEADDRVGAPPVVILSHRLWQERFGGAADVIGQSVVIDGVTHTVVGIMRPGFAFPRIARIWVPLGPRAQEQRGAHYLKVIGRLGDGATLERANRELQTISQRLAAEYDANRGLVARAESLRNAITSEIRTLLWLLLGAVMFVLLIACANVANLLLARATGRTREIAVRGALGASAGRILRQVLTESLVIAVAGGAIGVLLSMWWLDLMLSAIPVELPYWMEFGLDWRLLMFVIAAVCGSSVVFGLAPALQLLRVDQHAVLKDGTRRTGGSSRAVLRGVFVVAQFAGSLVLLVGGLLMIRSFLSMRSVDPGFDTSGIVTMRVALPQRGYEAPEALNGFHAQLLERLRARPEIAAAELVNHFPISGATVTSNFTIEGTGEVQDAEAHNHGVTPGYFQAMGIPLVRGRAFAPTDVLGAERVAIINETLAQRYFGEADPLGRGIRFGGGPGGEFYRIVGVAADVNQRDMNQARREPSLYRPFAQSPWRDASLVVRMRGAAASAVSAVRDEVRALDANIPVYDVQTVENVLQSAVWDSRFSTTLFSVFAVAALLLASIGLYGVIAQTVAQRTHELGVRVALGATRSDIMRLVLRQGMRLTAYGVAVGLALAFAVSHLLSTLLFGVSPTDPLTFAAVPTLLTAVALLATYLPARRATRIDALTALKVD